MNGYGEWRPAGEGIRRKIYPPGNSIMSMAIEFEAGARGAAHSHPHEQITHVIEGRLRLTVDGASHELGPGEQLFVPGGAVHSAEALKASSVLEIFSPLRDDLLASVEGR
ncbi:cupin domain-containing protein [Cohnella zeiphila]|uniref:Cupin domain-containing protein n=1 Tax=Cohnella zeiphila TaxID=2761120 RepID=A0A7X0VUQ7_9BACL|nr:cupin domain-containing protein [Cohnella zeiphila]MBB6730660.1 cupin domain-containing protein [Cohnella zeiphila]